MYGGGRINLHKEVRLFLEAKFYKYILWRPTEGPTVCPVSIDCGSMQSCMRDMSCLSEHLAQLASLQDIIQ